MRASPVTSHFWQPENFDRLVRDAKELRACRRYIANNPAKAKLRPGEYILETAKWLDE